jgi:hypothetical protein
MREVNNLLLISLLYCSLVYLLYHHSILAIAKPISYHLKLTV